MTDIVAIIGATAAWIPALWGGAKRLLARSRVTLIPDSDVNLQCDEDGCGLRLRLALDLEGPECTIRSLTLRLEHEAGRTVEMEWVEYAENLLHFVAPDGQSAVFARGLRALALRVDSQSIVERHITFQDRPFMRETARLKNELREAERSVPGQLGGDAHQEPPIRQRVRLGDHFERGFIWQAGRYQLEIRAIEKRGASLGSKVLHFVVGDADAELLRRNLERLKSLEWAGGMKAGGAQDAYPEVTLMLTE